MAAASAQAGVTRPGLAQLQLRAFERALPSLPDGDAAVLYADAGAARALGACAPAGALPWPVRALERARREDAPLHPRDACEDVSAGALHIVVVITALLTDAHARVVRAARAHGVRAASVHVLTAVSDAAHAACSACALGAGGLALAEYEAALRQELRIEQPSLVVLVRHAPLPAAPLGANAFVSARGGAAEALPVNADTIARGRVRASSPHLPPADDGAELDDETLPPALPLVAHDLACVATTVLGARDVEAFAVGKAARAVARAIGPAVAALASEGSAPSTLSSALESAAAARAAPRTAAVVVVDRTCDLAGALLHGDSFVGRAAQALAPDAESSRARSSTAAALASAGPRCAEGAAAVERPLSRAALGVHVYKRTGADDDAGACDGVGVGFGPGVDLAEDLLGRRGRDAAMACRKAMLEAVRAQKLTRPSPAPGAKQSRSDALRQLADALDGAPDPPTQRALGGLSSLARCAAETLEDHAAARWDAAASAERVALLALAEPSTQSVGAVLADMLHGVHSANGADSGERPLLDLIDVITLIAAVVLLKVRESPRAKAGERARARASAEVRRGARDREH